MTIENHSKEKIYVSHCNCGYGGTDPGYTKRLLERLSIPVKIAKELSYCNGFKLEYNENNEPLLDKIIWELPFVSREQHRGQNSILFDHDYMAANLLKKQLYFVQPRGKSYKSLLQCIDVLSLEKMHIYIGSKNENYFAFDIPYNLAFKHQRKRNVLEGSYIYFEAEPFDVICLIGNEIPASMVNSLYFYITGKTMFLESMFGKLILTEMKDARLYTSKTRILKWVEAIKMLLKNSGKMQELYHSVDLKKGSRYNTF